MAHGSFTPFPNLVTWWLSLLKAFRVLLSGAGQTSQRAATPPPSMVPTSMVPTPPVWHLSLPVPLISASARGPPPLIGDSVFVLLILRLLLSCAL